MRRALPVLALLALLPGAAARAAPDATVEITVTAVEVDAGSKPVITEVELNLTNRSERTIKACDVTIGFLDAAGKVVMSRTHALGGLDLKPGAETLASFQDTDPPQAWNRTVSVVAKCH